MKFTSIVASGAIILTSLVAAIPASTGSLNTTAPCNETLQSNTSSLILNKRQKIQSTAKPSASLPTPKRNSTSLSKNTFSPSRSIPKPTTLNKRQVKEGIKPSQGFPTSKNATKVPTSGFLPKKTFSPSGSIPKPTTLSKRQVQGSAIPTGSFPKPKGNSTTFSAKSGSRPISKKTSVSGGPAKQTIATFERRQVRTFKPSGSLATGRPFPTGTGSGFLPKKTLSGASGVAPKRTVVEKRASGPAATTTSSPCSGAVTGKATGVWNSTISGGGLATPVLSLTKSVGDK